MKNPASVRTWVAAVGLVFCNLLVSKCLRAALQKVAFWLVKGGLLQAERPPFAARFAVFGKQA